MAQLQGYDLLRKPGHILCPPRAENVFAHRLVLFDKIGYGPHWCHWCGRHINWSFSGSSRLHTDHVDHDRRHNDPANLVESCPRCNVTRRSP